MGIPALIIAIISLLPALQEDVKDPEPFPIQISGANTLVWRLFDDGFLDTGLPDAPEDKWEVYNRTVLNASHGAWHFGMQADLEKFQMREEDQRLEKRFVEYRENGHLVTVGDYYATFGRGTAVSLVKTHESFGLENQLDTTLDGVRWQYNGSKLKSEVLAGSIQYGPDISDELYGAEASYKVLPKLTIGASAVHADQEIEQDNVDLFSIQADIRDIGDALSIFYEFTTEETTEFFRNDTSEGHASYLEVHLSLGDLTLTAEHKDLENFFFKYATPPILEEQTHELLTDFFAFYGEDLQAFKARADYVLPNGTLIYGVYSAFQETATNHPSYFGYERDIDHFYAGVEHSFLSGATVFAELGRRSEEAEGYYDLFEGPTTHGSVLASIPLTDTYSIEADYLFSRFEGELFDYQRDKAVLALARAATFSVSATWERSNLPAEVFFTGGQTDFYSLQFDYKLLRKHNVRLYIGDSRGGLKCSGGVCAYIPAFQGSRFEVVLRF